MTDEDEESLERARVDLEMIQAAYPDECHCTDDAEDFPLTFQLHLADPSSTIDLQLVKGYPVSSNVEVVRYHSNDKVRIDTVIKRMRETAAECQKEGMEGALACVGAAMKAWEEAKRITSVEIEATPSPAVEAQSSHTRQYTWISSTTPLVDRKSTFVAHVCRQVTNEIQVREALQQLVSSSTKMARATHHMWAYRIQDCAVLRHDNDDDGEDRAGSTLAHLLEMRGEMQVCVCVSRWYGGIHLGAARFKHISNVARELLEQTQDN